MLQSNRHGCVAVVRLFAREHLVEHHANRVNIAALVRDITARLLGADIVHRAYGFLGHRFVVLAVKPGNAEIHHLYRAVTQQHNVRALNIAMNNTSVVSVLQSA